WLIEWSRTASIIRMRTVGEESMPESATLAETIAHPVRLRIIQQLGGRSLTTAQLREALPDVTQATLYRHVRALLDAELLTVVEERKVRGALERTLALGEQMAHVDQEDLRALLGFGRGPLYADADDLAALQAGIAELLAPYQEDRGEGKRRRSLATVLLPEVGP